MQILVATCITMAQHQQQSWESNRGHRTTVLHSQERSCLYSLSLRLLMQVSNACKMALLGDQLQHWGEAIPYFCFSLDFWKGRRWDACFPVGLFPRNRKKKKKLEMYTRWFYWWHSQRPAQSIIFKQHRVHTFFRGRVGAVILTDEDSKAQWVEVTCFLCCQGKKLNSNTVQSLPTAHYITMPSASSL